MRDAQETRDIVVVGASAGGVQALSLLTSLLPASLPASVLVVMHTAPHSPSALHNVLQRSSKIRVIAAEHGARLEHGTVYVAVADKHLTIENGTIRLTRGPRECRVRPAVDALFRSVAIHDGRRAIGIVLTGTLDDGTAGLWAIKDRGGLAFVQDPYEAEYTSMPESAIEHVKVDFIGPVEALAQQIVKHCGETLAKRSTDPVPEYMMVENGIAVEADGMELGVMELGEVSRYTCPECHGVLVQIEEGSIVRFRCHTGHAFSIKTLMAELNVEIDRGLWDALRTIEEKVMLLEQAAERARGRGNAAAADRYGRVVNLTKRSLEPLRDLVKSSAFFDGGESR